MKRILFSLFSLFFVSLGFCAAQSEVENVFVKFCNEGISNLSSRYTLSINPGDSQDLCIYAENHSNKPTRVSYSFVPGNLTDWGTQTCGIGSEFEKFFPEKIERVLVLSGNAQQTLKEKILVPVGMSGMFYGCLAYTVEQPDDSSKQAGMFKIVVRKVNFLNIFAGGDSIIKNGVSLLPMTGGLFVTNSKVKVSLNADNNLTLSFLVKNDGNITQSIALSGMVYNFLGFQKAFSLGDAVKRVMPGQSIQIDVDAGMIPSYKGLYDVRVALSATPFFDFVPSGLDSKLLMPTFLSETAKFFVFSWIWVIVVLLIVAILLKLFWPKKKTLSSTTPVVPVNS